MASARLSLLYVSQFPPSPPRYGAQVRMHGLITAMAERHDVWAVSLAESAADAQASAQAMRAYCRDVAMVVDAGAASLARKRLLQLRSLASTHTFERHLFTVPALQRRIDAFLRARRFDAVVVEGPFLAHYRFRAAPPGAPRPRLVVDEHNVEYDLHRQLAGSDAGLVRRIYSAVNWRKLRREEQAVWDRCDGLAVTSARDEARVRAARPGARVAVVPNAVDLERFRPRPSDPPPDGRTVLFFGALDYFPNTDGILFFLDHVWPRVLARHPAARLRILGRRPPAALLARRSGCVEIPGFVEDLRPSLAGAAAVVAPLRIGGGTRLKILEAMAMARPVVSTALGAEGLEVSHGRELLLADEPGPFAAEVVRLLEDPALGARLGAGARALVEERYAWRASARALERLLRDLVAAQRASAGAGAPLERPPRRSPISTTVIE
jgi:sugar transferase (PEP-CTERM/EpsH1 system associated)